MNENGIPERSGGCLCGAITYRVRADLPDPSACHCGMCRRHHGALGVYTSAPVAAFSVEGWAQVAWYRSSDAGERGFCPHCGSKLFWRKPGGEGGYLDITMGSLARPTGLRLAQHIFVAHQGDYEGLMTRAECYAGTVLGQQPISTDDLATIRAAKAKENAAASEGRMHHGHCLCRAVHFSVAGPMRPIIVCHCTLCLRIHGHCAPYTAAYRKDMTLNDSGKLRWYQTSAMGRRGFCGACGSSLFWDSAGRETLSITAGALEDPTGLTIARHVYTANTGDYYDIEDMAEQWPEALAGAPPLKF